MKNLKEKLAIIGCLYGYGLSLSAIACLCIFGFNFLVSSLPFEFNSPIAGLILPLKLAAQTWLASVSIKSLIFAWLIGGVLFTFYIIIVNCFASDVWNE